MSCILRVLFVMTCLLWAVPPTSAAQWARTYGGIYYDRAESVGAAAEGGYVVAGTQGCGGPDGCSVWVVKLGVTGSVDWQKLYGSGSAHSVSPTLDGGYVVAGTTGGSDAFVSKLDASGEVAWQRVYSGARDESLYSVRPAPDGGYVAAGATYSLATGGLDGWVLKLDSNGSVVWQKTYGGADADSIRSVEPTPDGGYIVAGATRSFGPGSTDAWVLKLDTRGDVVWQKTYGRVFDEAAYSVKLAPDGGYVVVGTSTSLSSALVLRLDTDGGITWQKIYGASDLVHRAFSVQTTRDGGYIVAGVISQPSASFGLAWALKLDADGRVMWQQAYGGNKYGYAAAGAVEPTGDGGYVMVGFENSHTDTASAEDGWVLKLDDTGSIPGCDRAEVANAIASDSSATTGHSTATASSAGASERPGSTASQNYTATLRQQCLSDASGAQDIPTMSSWVLILFAALVAASGVVNLRKRN